jgi:nicotinamide mononucleotide (NMN) deamidase PncC
MVTYQDGTKQAWLQIPESLLVQSGAVSETIAGWMSERVLANTPHADLAASVTGHLGPQAPARLDGVVFIAVSLRLRTAGQVVTSVVRHRLKNASRLGRQNEAARLVLQAVLQAIESVAR